MGQNHAEASFLWQNGASDMHLPIKVPLRRPERYAILAESCAKMAQLSARRRGTLMVGGIKEVVFCDNFYAPESIGSYRMRTSFCVSGGLPSVRS